MDQVPEDFALIMTTASSKEEADKIARSLVEEKLAACTGVVPGMRSFYRWEGKINEDEEHLLLIKSRADSFPAVSNAIKEMHSYECPEILMLPISAGDPLYLSWLNAETV